MQKIKTGIYGGSFNPIHNGHIAIAKRMLELAGLDEIWLIVSPQNPLKTAGSLLDDRLRLEMTQRALAPYPQLTASDYEFRLHAAATLCRLSRARVHAAHRRRQLGGVRPLVSRSRHHRPLPHRHLSAHWIAYRHLDAAAYGASLRHRALRHQQHGGEREGGTWRGCITTRTERNLKGRKSALRTTITSNNSIRVGRCGCLRRSMRTSASVGANNRNGCIKAAWVYKKVQQRLLN